MINKSLFSVKKLSADKLGLLNIWTRREGWNPGIYDLSIFYHHQPDAFYGGFLNDELICTASAYQYNADYAFLGYYIVHPNYRNQGYGFKLTKYLDDLLKSSFIGMDGASHMAAAYQDIGFKIQYLTNRYRFKNTQDNSNSFTNILDLSSDSLAHFVEYDAQFQTYGREKLLLSFVAQPHATTKIFIKNDKICGYGVIRSSYEGFRIGPLLADTVEIGIAIIRELIKNTQGINIDIDIPDYNEYHKELVHAFDMKKIFSTQRMYKNKIQKQVFTGVSAPMSLEIG